MDSAYTVPERTTQSFTATIKDETGTVIPLANMTTITITHYNRDTGVVIGARNGQDVKNANGGTYHATSGLFTMLFDPADMAIVDDTLAMENHVALFAWTYSAGARRGQHEALFSVVNSAKVS